MRRDIDSDIDRAMSAVEAGELVIVPTSRWYMICCDAGNADACARIFAAKRRSADNSLLLVARSADWAKHFLRFSADANELAEAFWPGDIALILPWQDPAASSVYAAVGTPEALVSCAPGVLGELAERASCTLAATSANVSGPAGTEPAISTRDVHDFLADTGVAAPVVLDGGVCPAARPLTVVRCAGDDTSVVRDGLVHRRAVSAALGRAL